MVTLGPVGVMILPHMLPAAVGETRKALVAVSVSLSATIGDNWAECEILKHV